MPARPSLIEIQRDWNDLVPQAQARGIRAKLWKVPPHNREYGLYRLAALRRQLGIEVPGEPVQVSRELSHREIQEEWNRLVPAALAAGLRAAIWTNPAPSAFRGMRRLNWLRSQLGISGAMIAQDGSTVSVIADADFGNFTFGVELEFFLPFNMTRAALAAAINAAGVRCVEEIYNHQLRDHWKLTTDGSLGDYARGTEIVSPVLKGPEGFAAVRKVCKVLTDKGCTVRRNCGLHVHIGVRSQPVSFFRNLAKLYRRYEATIDSVLSPTRRGAYGGGGYCRSASHLTEAALDGATTLPALLHVLAPRGQADRYYKLNFMSYYRHGTVEFRHHQGTVEAVKTENWIKFCLRMAVAAQGEIAPDAPDSLDGLLDVLKAEQTERGYFAARQAQFAARPTRRV